MNTDTDNENLGGGSGGDTGMTDKGHQVKSARGTYQIGGNQVVLVSRKNIPPAPEGPSRIVLLAAGGVEGAFIDDGTVDVRGCKGVRITAGPISLPMASPETSSADTLDGVDIGASQLQKIRIQRGFLFPEIQTIEMEPNSIVIDAGLNGSLSLRAGMSQITIDLTGVTIIGVPMVQINPGPPPPPVPPDVMEA